MRFLEDKNGGRSKSELKSDRDEWREREGGREISGNSEIVSEPWEIAFLNPDAMDL